MFEFIKVNNDYDGTRKRIVIKGFKIFYIFFRILELYNKPLTSTFANECLNFIFCSLQNHSLLTIQMDETPK